jgi:hypothetical protein
VWGYEFTTKFAASQGGFRRNRASGGAWWCLLVLLRSAFKIYVENTKKTRSRWESVAESKGSDGEEEADGDAAAAFAHAVAPVGAPSTAAKGLHGEWRGYIKSYCTEQRWFHKDQLTRHEVTASASNSSKVHRRECYLATVQIKPEIFTLLRCKSFELFISY